MKNGPLYDVKKITDLRDMLKQSVSIYGDKPAFLIKDRWAARRKVDEEATGQAAGGEGVSERILPYLPVSYKQFDRDVDAFGTRLKMLGLQEPKVAILAETRYEWYVTYLATVNGVGVVVPLDKELPQIEIENLLNRSQAQVLVYARNKQKELDAIRANIPNVRYFVCMDDAPGTGIQGGFWSWLAEGAAALDAGNRSFLDAVIDAGIMSILLFTSGTTAKSKAVMLSHTNICINLQAMCSMTYIGPDDIFLSVLPLHHTYECTCGFLCPIYRGCTVATCEGLRHITRNMQESKVTIMLVVPLMLELFYKRIVKAANADPETAKKFRLGLKISKALCKIGVDKRRQLFEKIHHNFGGHLRLLVAGGASIDPSVMKGMQDLGFHCIQGYGLTECAPILALNRDFFYNNASAGLPLPGVEIKIIDTDENGIGEIIGKGPNVMLGYYQDEEATRNAIDSEGYFHTGDLGYMDSNHFVFITGRKKNVIISKNGKNIFPEEIEFLLARSEFVAESLVSGVQDDEGETQVTAEIFPNLEKVQEVLGQSDIHSDAVRQLFADEVRKVNHMLTTYKYIKSFKLRAEEFEKTTSKKIKRKYV
jgi:long-chain acyl-CoA synthetase